MDAPRALGISSNHNEFANHYRGGQCKALAGDHDVKRLTSKCL